VQYLAPIIKNRQYNFVPIGGNPFVGATARPNEVTYSEPRLRPGGAPPQETPAPAPLPAEAPVSTPTDPGQGLAGLMVPQQGTQP